jgi:hypothetical protein
MFWQRTDRDFTLTHWVERSLSYRLLMCVPFHNLLAYIQTPMRLQKEPSIKMFTEKFGEAGKLYDVSIREDRYFVSELLALDSFVAHLNDIPIFANQLIMINLATLDVPSFFNVLTKGYIPQTWSTINPISYRPQTIRSANQHSPIPLFFSTHRNYYYSPSY